jgi:hypothetical protein
MFGLSSGTLIAGAIAALIVVGSFFGVLEWGKHWKSIATTDQTTIVQLHDKIDGMTSRQNTQTVTSTQTVTKVVQGPATIKTVIKDVDVPVNVEGPCNTPDYPQDVKDSF